MAQTKKSSRPTWCATVPGMILCKILGLHRGGGRSLASSPASLCVTQEVRMATVLVVGRQRASSGREDCFANCPAPLEQTPAPIITSPRLPLLLSPLPPLHLLPTSNSSASSPVLWRVGPAMAPPALVTVATASCRIYQPSSREIRILSFLKSCQVSQLRAERLPLNAGMTTSAPPRPLAAPRSQETTTTRPALAKHCSPSPKI